MWVFLLLIIGAQAGMLVMMWISVLILPQPLLVYIGVPLAVLGWIIGLVLTSVFLGEA